MDSRRLARFVVVTLLLLLLLLVANPPPPPPLTGLVVRLCVGDELWLMICDDEEEVDDCGRIGIWGGGIEVCVRGKND